MVPSLDQHIALYLDIDGTLLDVAPSPTAVTVPPGLVATLDRLETSLGGALAIVTGRRIADVDRLFAPLKLVAAGVHGAELRATRGGAVRMLATQLPGDLVEEIGALRRLAPGVEVEVKGAGAAVHYRKAPALGPTLARALDAIVAKRPGVVLMRGRKVLEVLPAGRSKGTALASLATLPTFRNRRPVFIGDDVGDEPAFTMAERFGGVGLKVAGEHFRDGGTAFGGPDEVRQWLSALADGLSRSPAPATPVGSQSRATV